MKYIFYFLILVNIIVVLIYKDTYFPSLATNNAAAYTNKKEQNTPEVIYDCVHITNITDNEEALSIIKLLLALDIRARIITTTQKAQKTNIKIAVMNQFVPRIKEKWQAAERRFPHLRQSEQLGLKCALRAL